MLFNKMIDAHSMSTDITLPNALHILGLMQKKNEAEPEILKLAKRIETIYSMQFVQDLLTFVRATIWKARKAVSNLDTVPQERTHSDGVRSPLRSNKKPKPQSRYTTHDAAGIPISSGHRACPKCNLLHDDSFRDFQAPPYQPKQPQKLPPQLSGRGWLRGMPNSILKKWILNCFCVKYFLSLMDLRMFILSIFLN